MSGKDNKPSIPSWQRAQPAPASPPPPSQEQPQPAPQAESTPQSTPEEPINDSAEPEAPSLLDQASKFLQDPSIQEAPREKKVAFLQSKGVSTEDINQLLGEAIEEEAASTTTSQHADTGASKPSSSQPPPKPQQHPIPPIITYPEFLAQPTAPAPLITTHRLLTTAYITGGLAATMYGLSKYIITPMTSALTESRHDFAQHTQEQLTELNRRLGDIVSVDPATKVKPTTDADIQDDISEADSDPTELFHRDIGTQTTPTLSRRPSIAANTEDLGSVTAHQTRLKVLTSHLRELEASRNNDSASSVSLRTKVADLSSYLTEMSYQSTYSYSGMSGLYGSSYGMGKSKDGKEDQVEVLRADIRAVKGVLLSARNFPAGGVRGVGRVRT